MSYCRFAWDGSDVYVIGTRWSGHNGIQCVACSMNEHSVFYQEPGAEQAMIDHLLKHREAGHTVPQSAIDRLVAERDGTEYVTDVEESLFDVMQRNPHMFGKTQREMDEVVRQAKEK